METFPGSAVEDRPCALLRRTVRAPIVGAAMLVVLAQPCYNKLQGTRSVRSECGRRDGKWREGSE